MSHLSWFTPWSRPTTDSWLLWLLQTDSVDSLNRFAPLNYTNETNINFFADVVWDSREWLLNNSTSTISKWIQLCQKKSLHPERLYSTQKMVACFNRAHLKHNRAEGQSTSQTLSTWTHHCDRLYQQNNNPRPETGERTLSGQRTRLSTSI